MLTRWLKQLHWPFIFSFLALIGIGTLFIHSASHHDTASYLTRQLFWASMGTLMLFFVPMVGYRRFMSVAYLFYWVAIFLLVFVMFFGDTRLGAQRWITLGPLAIQPSEFAKISVVMSLAQFLGERPSNQPQMSHILFSLLIAALPFALIVEQPDLGSAIIFIPMVIAILFVWGAKKRYFGFVFTVGFLAAPFLWYLLKPYQQQRILVFLNPTRDPLGSGYTAIQSKIAVGSGGLLGKGYMAGTQSQLQFVPEHHTDFIFCVIGEEWGYWGAAILLGLYLFLFRAMFQILESTTDMKAKLLTTGIVTLMFTQVFVNVGMTFGVMPIAGITLPLVSYGGSSLVATAFSLGMILSVYKERSIF